jgi:hypothetical protein
LIYSAYIWETNDYDYYYFDITGPGIFEAILRESLPGFSEYYYFTLFDAEARQVASGSTISEGVMHLVQSNLPTYLDAFCYPHPLTNANRNLHEYAWPNGDAHTAPCISADDPCSLRRAAHSYTDPYGYPHVDLNTDFNTKTNSNLDCDQS